MNISQEDYERYESGEDDIPVSLLHEISEFYKVDMTEILTGLAQTADVCLVRKGEGLALSVTTSMNLRAWPTNTLGAR